MFDDKSCYQIVDDLFTWHAASNKEYCHISWAVIFSQFKAWFKVWQQTHEYINDWRDLFQMWRGIWSTPEHQTNNPAFWYNGYVSLATQLLLQSTTEMVCNAILDDTIVLGLCNKGIYNHVADFCEHWNVTVDTCSSRNGPHSPDNSEQW